MEWVHAIADLLRAVAWPTALVITLVLFRREISQRVSSIREVKFPGGAVTLGDVERVADDLQKAAPTTQPLSAGGPERLPPLLQTSPQLTLAALIVDIDEELVKLWQLRGRTQIDINNWSREGALRALVTSETITPEFERATLSWFTVAEEVLKAFANLDLAIIQRTIGAGYILLGNVRRRRVITALLQEFDGHLLWVDHPSHDNARHIWSALASESPEFDYDIEAFNEAAQLFLARPDDRPRRTIVRPVRVEEYVEILRFRESELLRIIRTDAFYDSHSSDKARDYEWHWPETWGHISWNGPVVRGWRGDGERELIRTRSALAHYEAVLATKGQRAN